ncbi:MAG: tRNA (adenosine(37)-N6)-threonylcarbamoyltransferase complex transferase subunit TsaD [Candidatus Kaiserbacteria bacterium]|nr:tRNA (adenosine(37)-N6)-threonylcarbamoyltransferase complex transferase subunit TsaD [Candidatus Kaiserbacteria bacterium]
MSVMPQTDNTASILPEGGIRILSIETSCDETAIAILDCTGDEHNATFTVRGNTLLSQIEIHKEYGGVFPALAKREHAKNLVPILEAALEEAELLHEDVQVIPEETRAKISEILAREPGLTELFFEFVSECEPPAIDAIAVTAGPGLEPALWVGINFAQALALLWQKPLVAVNHMEGHTLSALAQSENGTLTIKDVRLPVLALLISGGHTELVTMKEWLQYALVGQTRDDAVGEAFDKVARMLALPYPGGPEISRLAESVRTSGELGSSTSKFTLPRPMLHDNTCDFSFAGLKTAALYLLKKNPEITEHEKRHIAHEFENAVADVLWKKTARALEETGAQTLVIGGGVSANAHIRRVFTENMRREYSDVTLCIPSAALTTDNAIMIAIAGFYRALRKEFATNILANGNLPLAR